MASSDACISKGLPPTGSMALTVPSVATTANSFRLYGSSVPLRAE